jgi:hypothetical protein
MHLSVRAAFVTGLLALSLGMASCGSSDDETGESVSSPVAKAVFIKQGDRICKDNYSKRTQRLTRLSNEFFGNGKKPPPQAQQEDILVNQLMPIFWEESEELNELPLPEEGTQEAEEILARIEGAIKAVEANPARSLKRGTGVEFRQAEELAHDFGFEWCGRS